MNIAFRVDASIQIGTGHVMRCLTLAHVLKEKGALVHFICRDHEANLVDFIRQKGFSCRVLMTNLTVEMNIEKADPPHVTWLGVDWETDAVQTKEILTELKLNWLIIDHYGLDYRWEQLIKNTIQNIMVIDDLLDRQHDCDLILDQTYGRQHNAYSSLVPETCRQLMGTSYALLKPDFSIKRNKNLKRLAHPSRKHLLISLGGIDKDNTTSLLLECLTVADLESDSNITVVMGSSAPWLEQVKVQAEKMPWKTCVKTDVSNMAELMSESDYAIGAAGTTTWERCCLGLPTILISLANNQANIFSALAKEKVIVPLAKEEIKAELKIALNTLFKNQRMLTDKSLNICDCLGIYRVIQYFDYLHDKDKQNISIRLADNNDINTVYQWQLMSQTRAYSRNTQIPSLQEHTEWMIYKLKSPLCYFYIIQKNCHDVGVIRLDKLDNNTYEISIYIDPDVFGKGVASNAITRLKSIHHNINIIAVVLPENKPSRKLFLANGFSQLDNETFLFECQKI